MLLFRGYKLFSTQENATWIHTEIKQRLLLCQDLLLLNMEDVCKNKIKTLLWKETKENDLYHFKNKVFPHLDSESKLNSAIWTVQQHETDCWKDAVA